MGGLLASYPAFVATWEYLDVYFVIQDIGVYELSFVSPIRAFLCSNNHLLLHGLSPRESFSSVLL